MLVVLFYICNRIIRLGVKINRFIQSAGRLSKALEERLSPLCFPTPTLTTWTVSMSSPWKLAFTLSSTSRQSASTTPAMESVMILSR